MGVPHPSGLLINEELIKNIIIIKLVAYYTSHSYTSCCGLVQYKVVLIFAADL